MPRCLSLLLLLLLAVVHAAPRGEHPPGPLSSSSPSTPSTSLGSHNRCHNNDAVCDPLIELCAREGAASAPEVEATRNRHRAGDSVSGDSPPPLMSVVDPRARIFHGAEARVAGSELMLVDVEEAPLSRFFVRRVREEEEEETATK